MKGGHIITFALGFILCFLLLKQCTPKIEIPKASHTEKVDTVFIKGDSILIEKKIYKPYPLYVYPVSDSIKALSYCDSLRLYVDTTHIDSTTYFIAKDSVIGVKTWSKRLFKSQPYIPNIITTITDSIPYPVHIPSNSLYLTGALGGSLGQFDFYPGVDLITKGKFSFGYSYGISQKTHNVKAGYLLFRR